MLSPEIGAAVLAHYMTLRTHMAEDLATSLTREYQARLLAHLEQQGQVVALGALIERALTRLGAGDAGALIEPARAILREVLQVVQQARQAGGGRPGAAG